MKNLLVTIALICSIKSFGQTYHMPGEDLEHEGTWLQWPHNNVYGPYYQDDVEDGWVTMTDALQTGEKVHIIAYDDIHKDHILTELTAASVPLGNVDFFIYPNNDVWVRDNGPIFVYDESDNLTILDWGFNGWGLDTPYSLCDVIPDSVSGATGIPRIDLSAMVLEGGSIEHDGEGTMIATRSCIVHPSRNPSLSESDIENYMTTYLGLTNFIWLDGVYGLDITDHHVDGFLKFANDSTIVTMDSTDLDYWMLTGAEITTIYNATNVSSEPYDFVIVPLTQNNVLTTYGSDLGIKGSYCNYYIGNDAVLVPIYGDPNDSTALDIIQGVYPNRTVVGVNVQNLYEYGGMTHCVTQQQPIDLHISGVNQPNNEFDLNLKVYPNPCDEETQISFYLHSYSRIELAILNCLGQVVNTPVSVELSEGKHNLNLSTALLENGVYYVRLSSHEGVTKVKRIYVKSNQ